MNELTLVEDFCASVPPPEAERLRAIRAEVLAATVPAPASRRSPRGAGRSLRGPGRIWPRAALTGGVAIVASAAVLATLGIPFGGTRAPAQPPSAADVLRYAAAAAYTQPVAQPGQYIYTEVTGPVEYPGPGSRPISRMAVVQTWQSVDGTKAGVIEAQNACGPLPETEPAALIGTPIGLNHARRLPSSRVRPAPPPLPAHCDATILPTSWSPPASTYAGLHTLPTSPDALLAYLNAHYQQVTPPGTHLAASTKEWSAISTILTGLGVVPDQLGSAMFRALARIPGRAVYPRTVDYLGRTGTAVGWTWDHERWELIFNPTTYQFMGEQQVALAGNPRGAPAGTRLSGMALVKASVADSPPKVAGQMTFLPSLWQSFAPGLPNTK